MLLIGTELAVCAKSGDDASQKQVLKLSASAPLDTIDISKATGINISTIKTKLLRGKRKLKIILSNAEEML